MYITEIGSHASRVESLVCVARLYMRHLIALIKYRKDRTYGVECGAVHRLSSHTYLVTITSRHTATDNINTLIVVVVCRGKTDQLVF